jgi:hypothetical protein
MNHIFPESLGSYHRFLWDQLLLFPIYFQIIIILFYNCETYKSLIYYLRKYTLFLLSDTFLFLFFQIFLTFPYDSNLSISPLTKYYPIQGFSIGAYHKWRDIK